MATRLSDGLISFLLSLNTDIETEISLLADDDKQRRIRMALKEGWIVEGRPVQDVARWRSFKLTGAGAAVIDAYLLQRPRR